MKAFLWKKSLALLALVFLAYALMTGCGQKDDTLKVTSQTWTEAHIIGHITEMLIEENTDYNVERIELESNVIQWQAIKTKEVDIWGAYTSTFFPLFEDDETVLYNPDEIYTYVSEKLKNEYDIVMLDRMGFYNNYGLAVTPEIAEQYKLENYSDLAKISSELRVAADANWADREDCYPLLKEHYNMQFKKILPMSVNAKYEATENGESEVISCYTTDAGIVRLGLKILEDDKHTMYHFDSTYVIRKEILDRYPELADLLNQVKITTEEMGRMNYQVEGEGMDTQEVARQYLETRGLIKSKQ